MSASQGSLKVVQGDLTVQGNLTVLGQGGGGGVSSITAGSGVAIDPTSGLGDVTVNTHFPPYLSPAITISALWNGTGELPSGSTGIITLQKQPPCVGSIVVTTPIGPGYFILQLNAPAQLPGPASILWNTSGTYYGVLTTEARTGPDAILIQSYNPSVGPSSTSLYSCFYVPAGPAAGLIYMNFWFP